MITGAPSAGPFSTRWIRCPEDMIDRWAKESWLLLMALKLAETRPGNARGQAYSAAHSRANYV